MPESVRPARGVGPLTRGQEARSLALVLLGALVVRLAAVTLVDVRWFADDRWYFDAASRLASEGAFTFRDSPTAYFPVGYPAILALVLRVFGASLLVAQLFAAAMSVALVGLTWALARSFTSDTRLPILAAGLLALLPNQVLAVCVPLSEIPFALAMGLAVLATLRAGARQSIWWAVVAGALFGGATLVRTQALFLPLLVPIWVMVGARMASVRTTWPSVGLISLVIAVVSVVAVSPWAARNHRVLNTWQLATNGGDNLYIGNGPGATGAFRKHPRYFLTVDPGEVGEVAHSRMLAAEAVAHVRANPGEAVALLPVKLWRLFRSDIGVINWIWDSTGRFGSWPHRIAQVAAQLGYLAVLAAAVAGVWYRRRLVGRMAFREGLIVTGSLVAYFSLITLVFFGDARFHFQLMPFLCILAAAGLVAGARAAAPALPTPGVTSS